MKFGALSSSVSLVLVTAALGMSCKLERVPVIMEGHYFELGPGQSKTFTWELGESDIVEVDLVSPYFPAEVVLRLVDGSGEVVASAQASAFQKNIIVYVVRMRGTHMLVVELGPNETMRLKVSVSMSIAQCSVESPVHVKRCR